MIMVSANFDDMALEPVTDTAQIGVKFGLNRRVYQRSTMFRAEDDVEVVFYQRLSHIFLVL